MKQFVRLPPELRYVVQMVFPRCPILSRTCQRNMVNGGCVACGNLQDFMDLVKYVQSFVYR